MAHRAPDLLVDPDADWSLPGWLYNDAEYFDVEVARVIRPSWQIVCHVSDIPKPGDFHTLDYIGESVIVVRGDDGQVRAFANVCRHRAMRLVEGPQGCAKKLICPYHAWAYELDGRLSGVPIFPSMSAGASDSMWFRYHKVPSYGASPVFIKDSDNFSHGLNERTPIANIAPAIKYYLSLFTTLSK